MTDAPAISLSNVTVRFDGADVLRDVSLDVATGEKVVLTGPSGSGKSTLLRCVLGFVAPGGGAVRIEGESLTPASVWRLRRRVTWVAQEPDLGDGTARDAIERPFTYRANAGSRKALEKAEEWFERFGLTASLMSKDVVDLSGGEKQRVGLVAALLLDRPILLLDEPTSALDDESRERVVGCLAEMRETTILSVAHDAANHRYASRKVGLGDLVKGGPGHDE